MNRTTVLLLALLCALLTGCGAGDEKLDPKFQKAFEDQGKRSSGQPSAVPGDAANPAMRGQALPPGTTPPPSTP